MKAFAFTVELSYMYLVSKCCGLDATFFCWTMAEITDLQFNDAI